MRIPAISKDGHGTFIDIDDILFISAKKKEITIHTENQVYRPAHSLSDWEKLLPFEQLERSNLVNMNKVKSYDPKKRLVCFHTNSPESKSCLVSNHHAQKLKDVNNHWETPNR